MEEYWMPPKPRQYVIGVPYEIIDIDEMDDEKKRSPVLGQKPPRGYYLEEDYE